MNIRRIYITGADCTGKSTLAQQLSQKEKLPVVKFTYEPDEEKQKEILRKYHVIAEQPMEIIMDRGWHGMYCYDGILGEQKHDLKEILALSKAFVQSGGTILFTTASLKVISDRLRRRGDEYITIDQLEKIIERYRELQGDLLLAGVPFYILDTTYL